MPYRNVAFPYDNIDKKPNCIVFSPITSVTLGDLHGSFTKLLYGLVLNGVIEIESQNYERLAQIYYVDVPDLNQTKLDEFTDLLQTIQLRHPAPIVRLIGDELADRGRNDYFTLMLIKRLIILQKNELNEVRFRILFSNHGAEFVLAYERYYETNRQLASPILDGDRGSAQANSLAKLNQLISRNDINFTWQSLYQLIDEYYQPYIVLLDFELDENKREFAIFSHAPIDLECIPVLAELFELDCSIASPSETARTIDEINFQFKLLLLEKRVHELYFYDQLSPTCSLESGCYQALLQPQTVMEDKLPYVLHAITWNRDVSGLCREQALYHQYNTHWVHGHTLIEGIQGNNCHNLDDQCAKRPTPEFHRNLDGKKTYHCLHHFSQPALRNISTSTIDLAEHSFRPVTSEDFDYLHEINEGEQGEKKSILSQYKLSLLLSGLIFPPFVFGLSALVFAFFPIALPCLVIASILGGAAALVSGLLFLITSLIKTPAPYPLAPEIQIEPPSPMLQLGQQTISVPKQDALSERLFAPIDESQEDCSKPLTLNLS